MKLRAWNNLLLSFLSFPFPSSLFSPLIGLGAQPKCLFSTSISNNNGVFFLSSQHSAFSSSNKDDTAAKLNFLVDSVGFTKEAAVITSSKVPFLKSTKNPQLVVNIVKKCGLDDTHIKDIISSVPKILNCVPKKTLEPKFRAFRDYGFSGSDLVELMKGNPSLLKAGLDTRIVPVVEFIRRLVGSNEELVEAIKKSKWLFSKSGPAQFQKIPANVLHLRVRVLSNKQIVHFITTYPQGATVNPSDFERRLVWIVQELGIRESSPMFVPAIYTTIASRKSTLDKKIKIFRTYIWSEEDIANFLRSHQRYLAYSEAKICACLDFLMKQVGLTPAYLASNYLL